MANLEELRETIRNIGDLDTVVRTMRALAMVNTRQYDAAMAALAAYGVTIRLGLQAALRQRHLTRGPMAVPERDGERPEWMVDRVTGADGGAGTGTGSTPSIPAIRRGADGMASERPGIGTASRPLRGAGDPSIGRTSSPSVQNGLILFGSDHGLCGPFNEQILALALKVLEGGGGEGGNDGWRLAVVGTKLTGLLEATGRSAGTTLHQPHGLAGVEGLMADLLMAIDSWRQNAPLGGVWLLYHRCRTATALEPVRARLLPIDADWLEELARRPWQSRSLPEVQGEGKAVLAALLREHLAHQLSEATVASLAAENTARLLAMQGARSHIEDRLAELTALYRQQRQSAITEELLDVVAGFEALNGTP